MRIDKGEWILGQGEMAAVAASFGLKPGGLSILPAELPPAKEAEEAVKAFLDLDLPFRALAERCLQALADPKKVVQFQNTVADERVSRCHLAWHPEMGGAWVSLVRSGDLRRVSLRSDTELRFIVANAVAADTSIQADRLSFNCTTSAALALLGALDHLRRARLISMLHHVEPVMLFSPEDVQARLADAAEEDFRWLVPFVAKLLPLPVAGLAVAQDPKPALLELEKAGLFERVNEGGRIICNLTRAGRFVEDGFRNSSVKAVLSATAPIPGGMGHDVLVLVRSAFDLFLLSMSGGDAALSTILAGDLDEILKAVFAPPPALPEPAEVPAPQGVEATMIMGGPKVPPSRLAVESGPLAGKEFLLRDGLTLGRQDDNGIVVIDPGISRHHAKFVGDEKGGWAVQDLGSSNGTFVNESRVEGLTVLSPGTRIRAGETVLIFDPPVS
jgi:hypothetical protein